MKGEKENGLRSGHMSGNGVHAGPFQAVTVNLFDLSLCKSLRRLKASLLDCGGTGEGSRFLLCPLAHDDNQLCFWPSCCVAIISCPIIFGLNVLLLNPAAGPWRFQTYSGSFKF